jgi:reactive intermediate/imine deaminase
VEDTLDLSSVAEQTVDANLKLTLSAVNVFENVKAIVEASGATLADVVKVNVYLADLANFAKMNEVYKRYFVEDYPARATLGTQLLGGMGIEVECVAVKG